MRTRNGVLAVERATCPGRPVLVHAGSPGSRRLREAQVHHAAEEGVCLLSYDRPGYGDSSACSGRLVADAAGDTAAIAEAFGYERLGVLGFSGGGPFALAAAAALPGLVSGCVVIASLAPYADYGPGWAQNWSADSQAGVDLFFTDRARARDRFRAEAAEAFAGLSDPAAWLQRWGAQAGTDEAHGGDMAEHLAAVGRDASRQGDQGWWDDWVALLSPWGFTPVSIAVPVQLWHGERDRAAPPDHGRWLAERIPTVEANFLPDADHTDIEAIALPHAYQWLTSMT